MRVRSLFAPLLAHVVVVAGLVSLPACRKETKEKAVGFDADADDGGPCAPARRRGVTRRFAVGVIPDYSVSSLYGEAPHCTAEFLPSDVVTIEPPPDGPRPRLVKEGVFRATCNGKPLSDFFEAVKIAAVRIDVVAWASKLGPLVLDVAHPEWKLSLRAYPLDACGEVLGVGHVAGARPGYARWKLGPGCEERVAPVPYDGERSGAGFDRPAEEIQLAGRAAGACTIEVDYFGVRSEVVVQIR
jgi:hypothetical protein